MAKAEDDKVQRYFDGEMPLPERVAFEAAMTDREREQLAALAEMRGLIQTSLEAEAAGFDIAATVEERLRGETRGAVVPLKRRLRPRMLLGTSAGLLIAAAAAFLFLLRPHLSHPSDDCDIEQLEVAGAEATVLTLPDHHGTNTTIIWTTEED